MPLLILAGHRIRITHPATTEVGGIAVENFRPITFRQYPHAIIGTGDGRQMQNYHHILVGFQAFAGINDNGIFAVLGVDPLEAFGREYATV